MDTFRQKLRDLLNNSSQQNSSIYQKKLDHQFIQLLLSTQRLVHKENNSISFPSRLQTYSSKNSTKHFISENHSSYPFFKKNLINNDCIKQNNKLQKYSLSKLKGANTPQKLSNIMRCISLNDIHSTRSCTNVNSFYKRNWKSNNFFHCHSSYNNNINKNFLINGEIGKNIEFENQEINSKNDIFLMMNNTSFNYNSKTKKLNKNNKKITKTIKKLLEYDLVNYQTKKEIKKELFQNSSLNYLLENKNSSMNLNFVTKLKRSHSKFSSGQNYKKEDFINDKGIFFKKNKREGVKIFDFPNSDKENHFTKNLNKTFINSTNSTNKNFFGENFFNINSINQNPENYNSLFQKKNSIIKKSKGVREYITHRNRNSFLF